MGSNPAPVVLVTQKINRKTISVPSASRIPLNEDDEVAPVPVKYLKRSVWSTMEHLARISSLLPFQVTATCAAASMTLLPRIIVSSCDINFSRDQEYSPRGFGNFTRGRGVLRVIVSENQTRCDLIFKERSLARSGIIPALMRSVDQIPSDEAAMTLMIANRLFFRESVMSGVTISREIHRYVKANRRKILLSDSVVSENPSRT